MTNIEVHGWEFSLGRCAPDCTRWWRNEMKSEGERAPSYLCDCTLRITHLQSGLQFQFQSCDAVRKYRHEKYDHPDGSDLPTYPSPLCPAGFDSAYVGRVFIQKPGEEAQKINPVWEDVDQETLHGQLFWLNKHGKISGQPTRYYFLPKERKTRNANPTRIVSEGMPNWLKESYAIEKDLHKPLVNTELLFLDDIFQLTPEGTTRCWLNLVVTDFGWFFSQRQHFSSQHRAERIREMTMHCNFKQNIIFREIIERQSKDFRERTHQVIKWLGENQLSEGEDGMCLHFHEVKQLVLEELQVGGSSLCMVHDAAGRYSSFVGSESYRKMNGKDLDVLDVSDDQMELLFANSSEQIEFIGKKTRTFIQIVPLFCHPRDPRIEKVRREAGFCLPRDPRLEKVQRKAYLYGFSKYNVDRAKSLIADFFVRTSQQCGAKTETQMRMHAKKIRKTNPSFPEDAFLDVASMLDMVQAF